LWRGWKKNKWLRRTDKSRTI